MAIHLIQETIKFASAAVLETFRQVNDLTYADLALHNLLNRQAMLRRITPEARDLYPDTVDYAVTLHIALSAQTFLFNTAQIMEFLKAIDRKVPPGDFMAPFSEMILQFTEPIPEELFLSGHITLGGRSEGDKVAGIIIGFPPEGEGEVANIILWYTSTAVNRVTLRLSGDGTVQPTYTYGGPSPEGAQDKQRIANLAMLCLVYMTSPSIEIDRYETPAPIQKRRVKDGKPPLPDYYICRLAQGRKSASEGEPTGRHVSFRFDVAGHFRRLPDGRTTWVRSHQRGLDHELYKPKVYKVD